MWFLLIYLLLYQSFIYRDISLVPLDVLLLRRQSQRTRPSRDFSSRTWSIPLPSEISRMHLPMRTTLFQSFTLRCTTALRPLSTRELSGCDLSKLESKENTSAHRETRRKILVKDWTCHAFNMMRLA